jgi:hypothetical protein
MSARESNMEYLGLNDEQYNRHCELMGMALGNWPADLKDHCQGQSEIYGFSGDALAVWVAEYIRQQAQESNLTDEQKRDIGGTVKEILDKAQESGGGDASV